MVDLLSQVCDACAIYIDTIQREAIVDDVVSETNIILSLEVMGTVRLSNDVF